MSKNHLKNNKGFVLLYAVLVTMVIVTVGVLMINIIARQIILSSLAKNSQIAFYAANAGIECSYHLYNKQLFGYTNDDGTFTPPSAGPIFIECQNNAGQPVNNGSLAGGYLYEWSFLTSQGSGCVDIEVSRNSDGGDFQIKSDGYNVNKIENNKCKIANLSRLTQRTIVFSPSQ
jgi:hypothetical protein